MTGQLLLIPSEVLDPDAPDRVGDGEPTTDPSDDTGPAGEAARRPPVPPLRRLDARTRRVGLAGVAAARAALARAQVPEAAWPRAS